MALRIPSPKALTKPEAYLAYKAGILSRDELKQNLYNPLNNYEGWLAKWCGLLETYPTNEDGTPQCLTDEEGLLAYLCGVTDRYPASNSRPDDARISAYIRYLVSARYIRPDHPLNREEFYLSLIKTQFIPSGDPSSDITIEGTCKAPFVDVKMYGDTFQQSYNGSNLIDMPIVNGSSNGITWVVNDDGSITLNGTTTANVNIRANGARIPAVAGETYTLSATGLQGIFNFGYKNSGSGGNVFVVTSGSPVETKQITAEMLSSANCLDMFITSGHSFNNQRVTLQLEKGSTATDFEPFVGGQSSPSPAYPQQIQTVTGEQTVKVLGKNLLNITSPIREVTNAGVHITIADDGKITIDGTATGAIWPDFIWGIQSNTVNHNSCKYYFPKALEAVTYSIKIVNGTVTGSPLVSVTFNDDGGKNASIGLGQPQARTTTDVNGINRVYLNNVKSGTIFNNFQFYLQIESGTTATEVVPYSELDYEIDLGDIELCKLGTYQDYIWKDGEGWKIHKATRKYTLTGSEQWSSTGTGNHSCYSTAITGYATSNNVPYSPYFGGIENVNGAGTMNSKPDNSIAFIDQSATVRFYIKSSKFENNAPALKTWLSTHNTDVYYALATATDTTITDQTLIAQLDSLVNGGAEDGTTYIKVNATDPNLPAKLYVEAPKYD